jgi:hypothetical protein
MSVTEVKRNGMRRAASVIVIGLIGVLVLGGLGFPGTPTASAPNPPSHGFDPRPFSCVTYPCLHPWSFNVSLTIANTMPSTATGTYQQGVTFNSLSYQAHLNGNLSNLYFIYGNGTTIPTWLENNVSNASANTLLWLRLYSIPAASSITVYADFASRGSFLWAVAGPVGVDPVTIPGGSGYGAFDDGAKVFNLYANFSGAALPSGWAAHGGFSYAFSSGITISSATCNGCQILSTATFAPPAITDAYSNTWLTTGSAGVNRNGIGFGTGVEKSAGNSSFAGFASLFSTNICSQSLLASSSTQGASCSTTPYYAAQHFATFSTTWVSSTSATFAVNYTAKTADAITTTLPSTAQPLFLAGSGAQSGAYTPTQHVSWIRERTYVATVPTVSYTVPTSLSGTVQFSGVVFTSPHNATFSWSAYSDPTALVSNYTLRTGPTCAGFNATYSVGTGRTTQVTNLLSGVEYCATVQAWVGGLGSALSSGTFFVAYGGANYLSAPTGLALAFANNTTVTVIWTNPFSSVNNDTVKYGLGSSCSFSVDVSTGGPAQGLTVKGLTPSTLYCFSVTAWNNTAHSSNSLTLLVRTQANPAATGLVAPSGLQLEWSNTTAATVGWFQAVSSQPVVNDSVFYGTSCGALVTHVSTGGAANSYTITGLAANKTYCAEVEAWNGTAHSAASPSFTFNTQTPIISKNFWLNTTVNHWNNLTRNFWSNTTVNHWNNATFNFWTNTTQNHWNNLTRNFWSNTTVNHWNNATFNFWTNTTQNHWNNLTANHWFNTTVNHWVNTTNWVNTTIVHWVNTTLNHWTNSTFWNNLTVNYTAWHNATIYHNLTQNVTVSAALGPVDIFIYLVLDLVAGLVVIWAVRKSKTHSRGWVREVRDE